MRHLPMEDMKLPSMPGRRYGCSGRPEGTQSPIFALSAPHVAPQQASNITLYYTALEGDSIFSIVAKLGRGVCNITRANRLMDAKYLFPGFSLIMPDAASNPDNDTCVLQAQNTTATCIYGGRLDCTTATNGPINRAALYKLNITVGSLWTENAENLQSGFVRRGPASQHDLEEKYGTTVGQTITLNFHYNCSSAVGTTADEALGLSYAIITLRVGCRPLVDDPPSNL
ncbi:hypothetical protein IFM61392_00812 [Aspergillus lentulus]|uniref:LysM domain-containing protein n=1 Tax=Aspergillus lentulus TaxID=293939 RepID=A0ABQ0ZT48_ASPLE|nr:hypothetical protein IFM60648_00972 [Aspergillus lentulus]GFF65189.1 hypothetical protein IFM62136_06216 [Aspergillus lentulus]GFF99394.1 hypothetical protein IFM61392_00812 [Aspergillus lentulus]